jgi:hypothetical protein
VNTEGISIGGTPQVVVVMIGRPSKALSLQRKCDLWSFGDLVTTGVAVFRYRARAG